jgi:hypothetical protein
MLDKNDIQAIGQLFDEKLKAQKEEIINEITTEIGEVISVVNESFSVVESKIGNLDGRIGNLEGRIDNLENKVDKLGEEIEKRPTRNEVFGWADRRIVDLEIASERHDFLHINELEKLPSPAEINKTLIERGLKQKLA